MHGHSAGGTNPSLVEAMFCRCNIVAYDVIYNRETTERKASFFKDETELIDIIKEDSSVSSNADDMFEIASRRYTWETIARAYEALY